MGNKLNEEIVAVIRSRLNHSENVVASLMQILDLGKESVYRRLRCEIPFTFDEVATLSAKLGFSVDDILGLKPSDQAFFYVDLHKQVEAEDRYYKKLFEYTQLYVETCKEESSESRFVKTFIPYAFTMNYGMLSKFRYYLWAHQRIQIEPNFKMSDLIVSQKIKDIRTQWLGIDKSRGTSTFLLSPNIFISMVTDISYFHKANLISENELDILKSELLDLINEMEDIARSGRRAGGEEIILYLLPFYPRASYSVSSFGNHTGCFIQIHGVDILRSPSSHLCQVQNTWIDIMKRYSVLITQSGEMERFVYFSQQREYILDLGEN